MTTSQTIAASEARNNFSDLISKVQYQNQQFLVERYGEIVAKIVPVKPVEDQAARPTDRPTEPVEKADKSETDATDQTNQDAASRANYQRITTARRAEGSAVGKVEGWRAPEDSSTPGATSPVEASTPRLGSSQSAQPNQSIQPTSPVESEENRQDDSSWSALKKLEELIAAQKVKKNETAELKADSRLPSGLSTNWPAFPQQGQAESDDQPAIIRKKIEL
jgi:antitoxin (DNA-binding transcriptional repressor) of toxin-antitoxin stability system